MARGRRENLIPASERSLEEARENGRKGGLKAAETYARRRLFKQLFKALMPEPFEENPEISNQVAIAKALILEAAHGNTQAFKEIRDTLGEKPKDEVESNETVRVTYQWRE